MKEAVSGQLSAFSFLKAIRSSQYPVFCHPERSEGSQVPASTRFFANPRMAIITNQVFAIAARVEANTENLAKLDSTLNL